MRTDLATGARRPRAHLDSRGKGAQEREKALGRTGLLVVVSAALALGASSAHAAPLSQGSVETVRGKAQVTGDVLKLRPGGAARVTVRDIAAKDLAIDVKRSRCATTGTLVVRLDGRRVLRRKITSRRLKTLKANVTLTGGDHRIDLVLERRKRSGCVADVRVSRVELLSPRRRVPVGTAVRWAAMSDPEYHDTLLRQFDSFTPENELKMLLVSSIAPNKFTFGAADQIVDLAERNGKTVRGHTLIWGYQLPVWITARAFTRAGLTSVMRNYIDTVMARYRGRIKEWDVVNEPMAPDGSLASNLWTTTIGADYVETALRFAHQADPEAKLFINEIATELGEQKFDGLLRLAADLKRRGVPLDGIGLQNHVHIDNPPSRANLAEKMRRIGALGLEVQITEMDVSTMLAVKTPRSEFAAKQARIYGDAAQACNEVPACTRFTVWGAGDQQSWLGPFAAPLLFDTDWVAKPALDAVRSAFAPRR